MRSVERVVDQCGCQVRDADRIGKLLRTQQADRCCLSLDSRRW
jgi:hypothetical protein